MNPNSPDSQATLSSNKFWEKRMREQQGLTLNGIVSPTGIVSLEQQQKDLPPNRSDQNQVILNRPWQWSEEIHRGLLALTNLPAMSSAPAESITHPAAWAITTLFGAYLCRLSEPGKGDIAFSSPILQSLECLPLRVDFDLAAPFDQALQALCQELKNLTNYLPLPKDGTQPQTTDVCTSLPVAITWLESDTPWPSADQSQWPGERQLELMLGRDRACWQYDSTKISALDLERLEQQLLCLINSAITQPERPLALQPIVPITEQQQLLKAWNQTQAAYNFDIPVHQLFEQQEQGNSNRIALQYEQQKITYGELNQRANRVAHRLIEAGLQPDDRVGIYLERSLDMIIALLGTLKAGGAYLPLDPSYPHERLSLMVEDAQPKVLLTHSNLQGRLIEPSESGDSPLELHLDAPQQWTASPSHNPNLEVRPHHLAYIIYTSGSTGRPKGVMIEHRALSNFAQAACCDYGIGGGDRVLQFASMSFDAAAEEIYPCLISGGRLVLRNPDMISSIPQFLNHCKAYGLTVLDLPTAYWHLLVAALDSGEVALPPEVRIVIIGGEAVNPQRVAQWQQMLWRTGCRAQLLNTYGPTEATVVATAYKLPLPQTEPPSDPKAFPPVTIGRPLSNVTTYVLDQNQQLVPRGVAGELCIGGAGIARGYLARPEKTAAQFLKDPFFALTAANRPEAEMSQASNQQTASNQARLYRTGDLVRYLANGEIEFLGRIDNQVKIRGFRIELGEIEARLTQQPNLEEGIVLAREDQPGQKRLVAYLLPKAEQQIDLAALRQSLSQALPEYMVPAAFVILESLPMTPSGKVDRKALPAPEAGLSLEEPGVDFVAPRTELEQQLVKQWETLLGRSPVGVTDNFLELGGDSLLAMGVITQVEQQFGQKLLLSTLFQQPTVEALAKVLSGSAGQAATCIMPLQSESAAKAATKPPLFFVNCAQDATTVAKQLGERYPVYGLNLFGASERLYDISDRMTLTDLAQVFIEDIRQVQAQGPYYLASYCGDTQLLLELAQELQRQGEEVALVTMIDPWWDENPLSLDYHIKTLKHFGGDYLVEKVKYRLKRLRKELRINSDRFIGQVKGLSNQAPSLMEKDVALFSAFQRATTQYQPQPYHGPTVMLMSEELQLHQEEAIADVLATFPIETRKMHVIAGYHQNLFQPPSLKILAEYLRSAIDESDSTTSNSSLAEDWRSKVTT